MSENDNATQARFAIDGSPRVYGVTEKRTSSFASSDLCDLVLKCVHKKQVPTIYPRKEDSQEISLKIRRWTRFNENYSPSGDDDLVALGVRAKCFQ
ncbi:MAG: hypothetical protein WBX08_00030 [Candidatus Sulfotelmatobacter sp.]